MLIWGLFWGAVWGAVVADWTEIGIVLGAVLGALVGWTLRKAIRHEIAAALKQSSVPISADPKPAVATPSTVPAPPAPEPVSIAAADQPPAAIAAVSPAPDSKPSAQPLPLPIQITPAPAWPTSKRPLQIGLNWLLGGNAIVRVGLVILFIGLSFLARYAAMAGLFPVELRLAAVGLVGVALLGIGFHRRVARPGFALALQGGGVGVLYLTVFAAFRLYGLVPPTAAFVLMAAICALSCALALLQDSRSLAVSAFVGGFAVPLLLANGEGNHVALFSYYSVLNIAILFIASRRAWRVLNVVGFLATFGVASAWGVLRYRPEHFATAQAFLALFVAIYIATAILYARQSPTRLGNAVDSTLVFGTPLIAFGLQVGLVQHWEMGSAFAALAYGAVYLMLAFGLSRRADAGFGVLVDAFAALGVGFATLAVPLALDAEWTSAVWAIEGLGAFWIGMRQARWLPRLFGLLLQGAAAYQYAEIADLTQWPTALLNPAFIGALLIALPGVVLAWWLRKPLEGSDSRWAQAYTDIEPLLGKPMFAWGFGFWCFGWIHEIQRQLPAIIDGDLPTAVWTPEMVHVLTLLSLVLSAGAFHVLGIRLRWAVATWPGRLTLVALSYAALAQTDLHYPLLSFPIWAIWLVCLAVHYGLLRQSDRLDIDPSMSQGAWAPWTTATHVGSVWVVVVLLAAGLWELIDQAELWATAWASVAWLISGVAILLALVIWAGRAHQADRRASLGWPLDRQASAYWGWAALPIAGVVYLGALVVGVHSSGRTAPLPYWPILNPTDLTLALAVGVLALWQRLIRAADTLPAGTSWVKSTQATAALGLLGFIALNTVWLRVAHHFFGVPWAVGALFESFVVQTGYAIVWTLSALALMVWAHRRGERTPWMAGAALLALVVAKLALIDLSNAGGVERIVAFIAVGALMLVVGYFAPLPSKSASEVQS